jgi:hypothetical protein
VRLLTGIAESPRQPKTGAVTRRRVLLQLVPGEMLLFYTDGVTEARNPLDGEYGPQRLMSLAVGCSNLCPEKLVRACVDDVVAFFIYFDNGFSTDPSVFRVRVADGKADQQSG